MPELADEAFDCIYCSGVLEHVDDPFAGIKEMTRVLKPDGVLLLGVPFRQAIHMAPQDFWRFTEFGIRHLLRDAFEICGTEQDPHGSNMRGEFSSNPLGQS